MPRTLVLSRSDVETSVDLEVLAVELRTALAAYTGTDLARRTGCDLAPDLTAMVLFPGVVSGLPAYTVKVHAKSPARRPALTGVMCLHDLATGSLLAILDSGWLTAVRTGVAAAIGTDVLAPADARAVGVIGAGAQGSAQLRALSALRAIDALSVFDIDRSAAISFAERWSTALGLRAHVADSPSALARDSTVILLATWPTVPVLGLDDIAAGTHLTSLGADQPGKVELGATLLERALVVADDRSLAEPVLGHVDTTLSEILRDEHPGRRSASDITVYSPVGLPMQDCVAAWHAYRRALALGRGTYVALEE